MPPRITINWGSKKITYWYPWRVVELDVTTFASMYDVLTLAMANGYRQGETFQVSTVTILLNDPAAL